MNLSGEQRIAAPRERVWAALNDPDVLRQCIPGCQSLDKDGDDEMRAVVEIKIGPIGARFNGIVKLSDLNPPASYTISGQGQGGTVGTAKGGAKVQLEDAGDETVLRYTVEAEVGGRLAQLGGPIIDATAKQLASKFFRQFGEVVAGPAPTPVAEAAPAPVASGATVQSVPAAFASSSSPVATAGAPWGWIVAVIVALLGGYYIGLDQAAPAWLLLVAILVIVSASAGFEAGKRGGGRR